MNAFRTCSPVSVRFLWEHSAWRTSGRAALAASLILLLAHPPLLAEGNTGKSAHSSNNQQIRANQRILHALNRFTFGPRPGEAAEVAKLGLQRWFDLQLNPAALDDSGLDARLANYPAMQLSIADLERQYPSPQMIRGMAMGRIPLPSDSTARILAQDQIAFYQMKQSEKAASKQEIAPAAEGMVAADAESKEARAASPEAYPHEAAEHMLALAPDQRLQAILAMQPAQLVALRKSLRGPAAQRLGQGMTAGQREILTALAGSIRMVGREERDTRVLRDVYSQRQLQAVMTDFWLNHFNVFAGKNQNEPYLIPSYERTIRANALGNFEDLLVATAESPAMLEYLDNFRSIGPDSQAARRVDLARQRNPKGPLAKNASAGLNENYGRELMELHTLGVNGGYTQADVTQVAEVFTGWTIDKPAQGGEFQFDERRHEPGSKVVLGKKIHENGQKEGLEVLHMLATSPATAHFISQQLAVRFVSDDPPPTLVDRMAGSFLSSHGDIRTVLRTLFDSPEFWSPTVYRAKVKTPEEFVLSAARASNLQIEDPGALAQSLQRLGMPLYGMQTPNGYSWMKDGWVSSGALVSRMNFALILSSDRLAGTRTDWEQMLGEANVQPGSGQLHPADYALTTTVETNVQKELRLEQALLDEPVSDRTRSTVLIQAKDVTIAQQAETQFNLHGGDGKPQAPPGGQRTAPPDNTRLKNVTHAPEDPAAAVMAGLLLGSPEFQRR